jgi:hypothetical protein
VVNLTGYLVNADADPAPNDIRLKWTARTGFNGTYSVWTNTVSEAFPGAWQELVSGIAPVPGPNAMAYIHDDAVNGAAKRFYLVISECGGAFAISEPAPIGSK